MTKKIHTTVDSILSNPKEFFDSLTDGEFFELLEDYGVKYEVVKGFNYGNTNGSIK